MRRNSRIVMTLLAVLAVSPILASFSATEVFLPSVGRLPGTGGSQWYTTMWIYNPNDVAANCTIYLLERDADNRSARSYPLIVLPGDTIRFENAVGALFGVEVFGALRISADRNIVVASRIYSQTGALRDSVGQFFGGVPSGFAIGLSQKAQLLGVYQTQPTNLSDFRYNFGFVETTGNNVGVRVRLLDDTGSEVASRNYAILPYSQVQKSFSVEFAGVNTQNARLEIEVTSGIGKVVAYGSGAANGSTDPSTFEMTFRDELLGAASTLTGVTAGAGLTGGGSSGNVTLSVATGGITGAMIADGTIANADVADNSILGAKLTNGSVGSSKLAPPIALSEANLTTLSVSNSGGSGLSTATLQSVNNSASAGIAGSFQSKGTDATIVLQQTGSGSFLKAFGPSGGDEEFRISNNGSLYLYDSTHTNLIRLEASTGRVVVKDLEVTGFGGATVPVAYGYVNSSGTKGASTSNVASSIYTSNHYEITFTGITYSHLTYMASVTPVGAGSYTIAKTYSSSGKLVVYIFNKDGVLSQDDFHYVIYKP